jgi:hypothetical protein
MPEHTGFFAALEGTMALAWFVTMFREWWIHQFPKLTPRKETVPMTEDRVFLEDSSNPNYLAMYQGEVERMNMLPPDADVDLVAEEFVLSAFPDVHPSDIIGCELVNYDPDDIPQTPVVKNDYDEPGLLEH